MKQNYSELRKRMDEILTELQDPGTDLDRAVLLHAEGKKTLDKLEVYLTETKLKVNKAKEK